jgi:hypothetical protein
LSRAGAGMRATGQEEWLDSPEGWPSRPTYWGWLDSPDIARVYGPKDNS